MCISVPVILLFEWLLDLNLIGFPISLVFKVFSLIVFTHFLLTKRVNGFKFKRVLSFFIVLNFIYSLFSENIQTNLYLTIRILYWVQGTLVFYYLYLRGNFNTADLGRMMIATLLIGSSFTIGLMLNSQEYQNANAYLLLWCLPLMFTFRQTLTTKLSILLGIIAIILTIKRGAILALVLSLLVFFLASVRISRTTISKMRIIGVATFTAGFIGIVFSHIWDRLLLRLQDTSGSGRDALYQGLVNKYMTGELHEVIFGFGVNSVQQFSKELFNSATGVAAHSDWFQYMFDFGLFGILFMLLLHYQFLRILIWNYKKKTNLLPVISMAYTTFSLATIYSFILNSPNALFFGILISVFSVETRRSKNFEGKVHQGV